MRKALVLVGMVVLLTAIPSRAAEPSERQKKLEDLVRQLEKDVAEVRGLKFKSPVKVSLNPPPKDAAKEARGNYSPNDKTLVVYDVPGEHDRAALVRGLVRALQDQHFDLEKLRQPLEDDDADLARTALFEGDATFTMIEVLKKDQPRIADLLKQGPPPVAPTRESSEVKTWDLYHWFVRSQGARYVKALKESGGWDAVNRAYRFPPRSTAQVLHPGERVSRIDLGPGKTYGEYGVVRMLASKLATEEALAASAGWRGDREVTEGKNRAWVIAFDTPNSAERFRSAFKGWLGPRLGPDHPLSVILDVQGNRVIYVAIHERIGPKDLYERIVGPLALEVYSAKDRKTIPFGEMVERLLAVDLVCVGETHDSDLHHRVQLQIIKSLFARDERLGVGMEMFQRPFQPGIDRYFAGKIDEAAFLKETEYRQRWGFEWTMYRPIVEFCRRNAVPLAALNAPRELTQRISKVGHAGLTDDEKKQLGDVDFDVKEHRDYWYGRLAKMHGQDKAPAEQKERSYEVMTVWDGYMAESAARFQQERGVRRMVILAGSGHVERGFGIPARAAKRTGRKVATVGVAVDEDAAKKMTAEPLTDFVVIVK